jgi:hypothetical protein
MHVSVPHAINNHYGLPCRWRKDGITQSPWIPGNPVLPNLLQEPTLDRQPERLNASPHSITKANPHTAEPFGNAPSESGLAGAYWPNNQDHPLVRELSHLLSLIRIWEASPMIMPV